MFGRAPSALQLWQKSAKSPKLTGVRQWPSRKCLLLCLVLEFQQSVSVLQTMYWWAETGSRRPCTVRQCPSHCSTLEFEQTSSALQLEQNLSRVLLVRNSPESLSIWLWHSNNLWASDRHYIDEQKLKTDGHAARGNILLTGPPSKLVMSGCLVDILPTAVIPRMPKITHLDNSESDAEHWHSCNRDQPCTTNHESQACLSASFKEGMYGWDTLQSS